MSSKTNYACYAAFQRRSKSSKLSLETLSPSVFVHYVEGIYVYIYIGCLKKHYAGYVADLGIPFEGLTRDCFYICLPKHTTHATRPSEGGTKAVKPSLETPSRSVFVHYVSKVYVSIFIPYVAKTTTRATWLT